MLIQMWFMYGASVHTNFVGDDWLFMQGIATTPLGALLKPGGGYHYNPILLLTIKVMYNTFGIHHVAEYHLLAYFFFWLSAIFTMLLARKLTGSTLAGALAGMLFIGFGTQYEGAIWGVVAYGPAMSTAVYAAGVYFFMLAHDDWRSRGQQALFYAGFMLALILGPFIYEQDITLVAACLLYRVFVIDQDLWRSGRQFVRASIARIPAILMDFALPALFFVGYLAFKVILGRMYPGVPETPGLTNSWTSLASTATLGIFQAFFPGLTFSEIVNFALLNIAPRAYLIELGCALLVVLIVVVKGKPLYKFLLVWAMMLIVAQTVGLGNISSRHLMLMTVPTAILWAVALTALPDLLAWVSGQLGANTWFAWQTGYGASLLLLLLFLFKGYRYSQVMQSAWRDASYRVSSVTAQLEQYAAADPGAQNLYLVNLPDYVATSTGEVMYEFRNSEHPIVWFDLPGRFSNVTGIRTSPNIIVDGDEMATVSQLDTWAKSPDNLVVVYDLSTGQLTKWQAPKPLIEYYNPHTKDHWVTSSLTPLADGYTQQRTLAYLSPFQGPDMTPLFSCVTAGNDHFVSSQPNCEGATPLQFEGWLYPTSQADTTTTPLFRCRTTNDHYVSVEPTCGGGTMESPLGYASAVK